MNVRVTWRPGLRPAGTVDTQVFRGYRVVKHDDNLLLLEGPRGMATLPMNNILYWEERKA